MKRLLALSLILLSPSVVLAQPAGETAKKPTTKTAAKAPAKKTETSSRTQLNSAANQAAAGIRAADVALTPAELRQHAAERAALGIPPLPLDAQQVAELIELIKAPPAGEEAFLLDLLTHRVPPGVDDAAKVKASFLAAVAHGDCRWA
jgi:hypothetical protein